VNFLSGESKETDTEKKAPPKEQNSQTMFTLKPNTKIDEESAAIFLSSINSSSTVPNPNPEKKPDPVHFVAHRLGENTIIPPVDIKPSTKTTSTTSSTTPKTKTTSSPPSSSKTTITKPSTTKTTSPGKSTTTTAKQPTANVTTPSSNSNSNSSKVDENKSTGFFFGTSATKLNSEEVEERDKKLYPVQAHAPLFEPVHATLSGKPPSDNGQKPDWLFFFF
jgi:hypothetical protein